jgi:2,3-diketo-5-methylthiopentyl-1-phosphate enolase
MMTSGRSHAPDARGSIAAQPEGVYPDSVVATYLIRVPRGVDAERTVRDLAAMQSTGTWVDLPGVGDLARQRHQARVLAISGPSDPATGKPELGDGSRAEDSSQDVIARIGYPAHNIGGQIPLLLATVLGEGASMGDVRLLDLDLPASFTRAFSGPRFGIAGIRARLGVQQRPLLITVIKPALGLSPRESGAVVREVARGGSDAVKDDELLVEHPWSQLEERVREHERACREVFEETGQRSLCFINVTDRPDRLVERALRAVEAGASGLMVDYVTVGVSALAMLADHPEIPVPILGHLAMAGALYAAPRTGMSSHLILGTLPRLAGADAIVYPSPIGTLRFSHGEHLRVAAAMTQSLHEVPSCLPVIGGGIHPGTVPGLIGDLGIDAAFDAGGAVHGHPMGAAAGARALRQAIDAVIDGEGLAAAADRQPELAAALKTWAPEMLAGDAR